MSLVNDLINDNDELSTSTTNMGGSNSSTSSSSGSISSNVTSLQIKDKYDRLAQEYTKLKTKLNVLKKAYVELSENCKEKDQLIRKAEQEIESLSFRNRQLVTRISVLQNETDRTKTTVTTGASTFYDVSTNVSNNQTFDTTAIAPDTLLISSSNDLSILREELEHKINENAYLHTQLNEIESLNKQKLNELEENLSKLLFEKKTIEEKHKNYEQSQKKLFENLESEKKKLEINLNNLEKQFKEYKSKNENYIGNGNKSLSSSSSSSLLQEVFNQKNENGDQEETEATNEFITNDLRDRLVNDLMQFFNENINNLHKIYTLFDEKLSLMFNQQGSVNSDNNKVLSKLNDLLKFIDNNKPNSNDNNNNNNNNNISNSKLLRYFKWIVEFISLNKSLLDELINSNNYLNQIELSYITVNNNNNNSESNALLNTNEIKSELNKVNFGLVNQLKFLSNYLTEINIILTNTFLNSNKNKNSIIKLNKININNIHTLISKIYSDFKQLLVNYNDKLTYEHLKLSNLQNIITLDECINFYLNEFYKFISRFKVYLNDNSKNLILIYNNELELSIVTNTSTTLSSTSPLSVSITSSQPSPSPSSTAATATIISMVSPSNAVSPSSNGNDYIKSLVDTINVLKEGEILLKMDLANLKEKINQDKSLLFKYENEIKELKNNILKFQSQKQENIEEVQEQHVQQNEIKPQEMQIKHKKQNEDDLINLLDEYDNDSDSDREYNFNGQNSNDTVFLIKKYFKNQIVDLKYQLFLVDGKATYYYQEADYLNENLKQIINDLNKEKEVNVKLKLTYSQINDELDTTRQRYEDQIRTMSEHIATMNDKLTEQAEEIEKLNHFIKNTASTTANQSQKSNKKSK